MADPTLPHSPFAGTGNFYDDGPIRSIAPEELARTLQAHEVYVESKQRSGKRADLDSRSVGEGLGIYPRARLTGTRLRLSFDRARQLRWSDYSFSCNYPDAKVPSRLRSAPEISLLR